MMKKETGTLTAVVASFVIAIAISAIAMQRVHVCWHCLRPMTLDYQRLSERFDGSWTTLKRWRCPKCDRTVESSTDAPW